MLQFRSEQANDTVLNKANASVEDRQMLQFRPGMCSSSEQACVPVQNRQMLQF
jgi:hypothetical protein